MPVWFVLVAVTMIGLALYARRTDTEKSATWFVVAGIVIVAALMAPIVLVFFIDVAIVGAVVSG